MFTSTLFLIILLLDNNLGFGTCVYVLIQHGFSMHAGFLGTQGLNNSCKLHLIILINSTNELESKELVWN
jgi:hypothetical protein